MTHPMMYKLQCHICNVVDGNFHELFAFLLSIYVKLPLFVCPFFSALSMNSSSSQPFFYEVKLKILFGKCLSFNILIYFLYFYQLF